MRHEESNIQKAVIRWWAMAHRGLGVRHEDALMAIPMGGKRDPISGARLKAEGARKGTSDLFLAVPRKCGLAGLWIELKKPKGRATTEQHDFLDNRRKDGYAGSICFGFDDCVKTITEYLSIK